MTTTDEVSAHFCSPKCQADQVPCDLCLAQRRKHQVDLDIACARPTLRYNPFAELLKRAEAKQ